MYVDDVYGNNVTGTPDRPDLPYLTISGAYGAANAGDTIHIRPGTYTVNLNLTTFVNFYFENGTTVTGNFMGSSDFTGYADFVHGGFAPLFDLTGGSLIECNSITSNISFTNIISINHNGSTSIITIRKSYSTTSGSQVIPTLIFLDGTLYFNCPLVTATVQRYFIDARALSYLNIDRVVNMGTNAAGGTMYYNAKTIMCATGGEPGLIPLIVTAGTCYLTSDMIVNTSSSYAIRVRNFATMVLNVKEIVATQSANGYALSVAGAAICKGYIGKMSSSLNAIQISGCDETTLIINEIDAVDGFLLINQNDNLDVNDVDIKINKVNVSAMLTAYNITSGNNSIINASVTVCKLICDGDNGRIISITGAPSALNVDYYGDLIRSNGTGVTLLNSATIGNVLVDVKYATTSNTSSNIILGTAAPIIPSVTLCGKFVNTTNNLISIVPQNLTLTMRNCILVSNLANNTILVPANTTLRYYGQITRNTSYSAAPATTIPAAYPLIAPDAGVS